MKSILKQISPFDTSLRSVSSVLSWASHWENDNAVCIMDGEKKPCHSDGAQRLRNL